jgi:hypothetical protein
MDQPEAFLKYIKKHYLVVSMLAIQVAKLTNNNGSRGRSGGGGRSSGRKGSNSYQSQL